MQVLFNSRDSEASEAREFAVRRVQFVMRRLTWLVPRATVQLSDINGPRGGVDKRCQIALRTDGKGTVVVTAIARDWRSALDAALARASRLLVRLCHRDRAPRRPVQRTLANGRSSGRSSPIQPQANATARPI
jgi:hypothetical protein